MLATPGRRGGPRARAADAGAGRRGRVHHRPGRGRPDPDQRVGQTPRRAPASRERLVPLELPAYFLQVRGSGPALAVAAAGALDPMGLTAGTAGLLLDARDLSSRRGGRPARGRAGDERQRLPLRRARLPERQRDDLILLAILFSARRRADARRHPDRDVPGALRRAARPGHAVRRRGRAPDPPRRRGGVRAGRRLRRRAPGRGGRLHPRHRDHLPAHLDRRGRPAGSTREATSCPATSSTSRGCWCSVSSWSCRSSPPLIVGLTARSRLPLVARLD